MAEPTPSALAILAGKKRPHRKDLEPGEVLCEHCPAKCCRYFALPIDTPTEWQDFDYIRWYLLHERAAVFVEEGIWYLLVHAKCQHLREDQLCEAYDRRPQICRDYHTKDCEYEDDWVYDHYWEVPQQVEEYAEAVLGPRKGHSFRSPKPHRSNAALNSLSTELLNCERRSVNAEP